LGETPPSVKFTYKLLFLLFLSLILFLAAALSFSVSISRVKALDILIPAAHLLLREAIA
jgi:hypothetical protein